jgi:hypothetical protein
MDTLDPAASALREKHPRTGGWQYRGAAPQLRPPASVWQKGRFLVVSSLDQAELPDGSGQSGPQWHLSISILGAARRARDEEVARALAVFGLAGAEEDNHEPGRARHFWLVVDPARRVECECKTTETVSVEPDGHRWSTPKEGPCSGCANALLTGMPCTLHGARSPSGAALRWVL